MSGWLAIAGLGPGDDQLVTPEVSAALAEATDVDRLDGLSLSFPQWRVNLRKSNTEPVLRLNVESRGDRALMEEKTKEILGIVDGMD